LLNDVGVLSGVTVLRGQRSIHVQVGVGMMALGVVGLLLAIEAATSGGGARPGVAISLFALFPLFGGVSTLTARVIVDDAAMRWRGLFLRRRSVARSNFLRAEVYRCRPGRGGGPQWGIRIWQIRGGAQLLPLRWAYTEGNRATLEDLCRSLDGWRTVTTPSDPDRRGRLGTTGF
jgi:hypothetical protein